MNLIAYILAERDLGWVEIVIIAIVLGLSALGSLIQKIKETKEQEGKARKPRPKPEQRVIPKPPRTVRPARAAPPAGRQAQQSVRVSEELRLRQQREAQLEQDRQKRLAARRPPQSDTDAIEARLVSVRPTQRDATLGQIGQVGGILKLATPADAKRAMIMHEIFSPPKALRQGGEIWDI